MILFLDFDGVLCDSSPECGIVSANARLALRDPSHAPLFSRAVADDEAFARFLRLRYLVRTAGHGSAHGRQERSGPGVQVSGLYLQGRPDQL